MISELHYRTIRRWLEAERRGREAEAESALRQAFQGLASPRAPSGLVEVVMRRIGPVAAEVVWGLERVALVAAAAVIAAVVALPAWVPWVVGTLGTLASFTGAAFVSGARWLVDAVEIWETLAAVGGSIRVALLQPEAAAVVAACVLTMTAAARFLHDALHERIRYVDS